MRSQLAGAALVAVVLGGCGAPASAAENSDIAAELQATNTKLDAVIAELKDQNLRLNGLCSLVAMDHPEWVPTYLREIKASDAPWYNPNIPGKPGYRPDDYCN